MNKEIKRLAKKYPKIANLERNYLMEQYIRTQELINRAVNNLKSADVKFPEVDIVVIEVQTEKYRLVDYLLKKSIEKTTRPIRKVKLKKDTLYCTTKPYSVRKMLKRSFFIFSPYRSATETQ